MEGEGYALPVIEAHCAYRQSAKYDDALEVHTRGTLMSPVRVRFDYQILRPADLTMLADGHTVHVAIGPSGKPRRLPDRVRGIFVHTP